MNKSKKKRPLNKPQKSHYTDPEVREPDEQHYTQHVSEQDGADYYKKFSEFNDPMLRIF